MVALAIGITAGMVGMSYFGGVVLAWMFLSLDAAKVAYCLPCSALTQTVTAVCETTGQGIVKHYLLRPARMRVCRRCDDVMSSTLVGVTYDLHR